MAGNVNLIDPNSANINENITNGIPQYQDMYIYVGLTAIQRQRTVLTTEVSTDITKVKEKATQEGKIISFLGENQNPNNSAHFNKFTTNYYDRELGAEETYEGFGINNIDIVVNSSYIPQIDIEFVDIRGLTFFNRENSPYRILFDFPPPIFHLTYKGYYGKGINYQMHLVKYQTEFKAETGNYHINAQFIAISYAPLTDILFRYIIQAPFMLNNDDEQTLSSEKDKRPKNTFDLILKLENLYSSIPDKIKTDVDNVRYENAKKKLNSYDNVLEILYNFRNKEKLKRESGEPILFTKNEAPDSPNTGEIKTLPTFADYDEYLQTFQTRDLPRNVDKKIFIGYLVEPEGDPLTTNTRNNTLISNLNEYKNNLITSAKEIVNDIESSDIKDATEIYSETGAQIDVAQYVKYIGLNITNFYTKIYKNRFLLQDKKRSAMQTLNQKINNMIQENLGMLPTIYNIFEILLNDVDTFFNKLRKTSNDAETHHEKYKRFIANDGTYKDVDSKIYPFPLIVRQEKVCNQTKEVRAAPINISDRIDEPFPELILVQEFIDSFIRYNRIYEQATLKDDRLAGGDYKWIPITPSDSIIVSPNLKSPYFGTDNLAGGSAQQPINLSEANKLTQIFEIFLERFYILSQNSLAYSFYAITDEDKIYSEREKRNVAKRYIKLYAKSEAINLANSVINEKYAKLLKEYSINNNADNFYTYLNNNLNDLYTNFTDEYTISNGYDLYRDKRKVNYRGFEIVDISDISLKPGGSDRDELEEFLDENKTSLWQNIFGNKDIPEEHFVFTDENVIFIKDTSISSNASTSDKDNFNTKFIYEQYWFGRPTVAGENLLQITQDPNSRKPFEELINGVSNHGNKYFALEKYNGFLDVENKGVKILSNEGDYGNIIDAWAKTLGNNDDEIYEAIIKYDGNVPNTDLTAILYLSNFGYTTSAFNYQPHGLNPTLFTSPAIIEAPKFVELYMGALVNIEKDDELYNNIYNFFSENGSGRNLDSGGMLIFADIHDINMYLSDTDKDYLQQRYLRWLNNDFNSLASSVDGLYKKAKSELNEDSDNLEKRNKYEELLLNSTEYSGILTDLTERVGFAVFNEITFRYNITPEPADYISLQSQNQNNNKKSYNDLYFNTFFNELSTRINDRLENLENEREEFKNSTGDEDILTQTYYSFKNINDKWLSGLNKNTDGYPFKTEGDRGLISQFAFVDRAMNPIGDTIIDPKSLIDAKDSPDLSIFSVISQLLSLNGFEFFPLQSFLKFNENEWEDSFKINTGGIQKEYPVFVCMYIGGSSSYPSNLGLYKPFEDDGITKLENPNVNDYLAEDCAPDPDKDNQVDVLTNDGEFLNEVRAFKVRYGEQNQNMFFDFGIDSKEYPETNESIQILSRLAGDNKQQAPVPKGQNLYNIYENRAYRATITGFGNAMIQPTQYFQLENVPLYNGAYVILTVEHNIKPNMMTTKFSGTKLLKYPMPRVKNPASILGFEGGSTDETNADAASAEDVTLGVGTANNPDQAKYNSMYTLQIY